MAECERSAGRCDLTPAIAAELAAAGLDDAAEVGVGGFGAVYRCEQRSLERTVAVKVLTTDLDPDNVERFLREQRAMGKLCGHPNIVSVFDVGTTATGRPYIVMQYHPQDSLRARIHSVGPLTWVETLHIGVKIAGALETAHRLGTLHRDIKPANILLTEYGEPQLADFGIARMAGGFETATGVITGSPAYTAPEVLLGRSPTPASDVYSLGATLFCALTGHAAFERRSGELVVAQFLRVAAEPTTARDLVQIPDDVSAAIGHAMESNPDDRPTTAADFGNKLRHIQSRHGLTVDDMDVPTGGDGRGARGPARYGFRRPKRAGCASSWQRTICCCARVWPVCWNVLASTWSGRPATAAQLLAIVREMTPDLVVTDIRMPPANFTEGLDAARIIRAELPHTAVVVLSAHVDVEHAMELLAGGRSIGYLLKSRVTDVADFIETLQRVTKGASVMDPALVQELVSARRRDDPLEVLSAREHEVLALMAEGRSNAGIAHRLWVTEGTVEKHVRSILTKLNLPETGDDHRRVLAVITFLEAH